MFTNETRKSVKMVTLSIRNTIKKNLISRPYLNNIKLSTSLNVTRRFPNFRRLHFLYVVQRVSNLMLSRWRPRAIREPGTNLKTHLMLDPLKVLG